MFCTSSVAIYIETKRLFYALLFNNIQTLVFSLLENKILPVRTPQGTEYSSSPIEGVFITFFVQGVHQIISSLTTVSVLQNI